MEEQIMDFCTMIMHHPLGPKLNVIPQKWVGLES